MNIKYFFERLRDVNMKNILSFFPMCIALLVKFLYKDKYKDCWLICEEPAEARDNGYYFYKYMCENQPQKKCYYAIKKKSIDYCKVADIGEVVQYGSIMHWIIYFLCEYNISSQKGGKPDAVICAFMELNGWFRTKNVFLQHGVIINDLRWLYADRSKIDVFITSTIPETCFVRKKFGYQSDVVCCTGLARFDTLHVKEFTDNQIIIMPTWRYWFNLNSKKHYDTDKDFQTSEFVKRWKELLNSPFLDRMMASMHIKVVFYMHRNLQRYDSAFNDVNPKIKIASWKEYDIQQLLRESSMMITDYSSVFFDMVYMKKPIIFYQFDENKYRKYQYNYGYFDYHNNPFGKTFRKSNDVLKELEELVKHNYSISEEYISYHKEIFENYDNKNSERIYNLLVDRVRGSRR